MGELDLLISVLSIPAGHLYGIGADWILEKLNASEQDNLNKAIKDALKRFFEDADISKTYQWVYKKWYKDIKSSKIPLNQIVTRDGLLGSLESYYPEYQNQKEKLEDAVNKILPYIVSRLIADPRATAFIVALKETTQKQIESEKQDERDNLDIDTNRTVHGIQSKMDEVGATLDEINKKIKQEPEEDAVHHQPSAPDRKQADNQYYLDHFTEPLFLEEDDDSHVTLASMYVSPHLEGEHLGGSMVNTITLWFKCKTRSTCMLLLGNAGVGKSSLVSKIIADANSSDVNKEFQFNADDVLAVALRNQCDKIDWTKEADKILMDLFSGYSEEQLKRKLLILDGLDEICVLCNSFDGYRFLEELSELERGFHVLVTSRDADGYFSNPHNIRDLQIETLRWTSQEVEIWCSKYCETKKEKKTWCDSFLSDYMELPEEDKNDHRKEAFCIPIILYICGDTEIKLSDHKNIGSIYKDAFSKILSRDHLRCERKPRKLKEADRKANKIAWQYTKEIAYQMFLLDTLDLVDSSDPKCKNAIGLKNAKARSLTILRGKSGSGFDVSESDLEIKKELALCPFAKRNGTGGITFAHKTVYEYFTAVKLYEDYFSKFNKSYFSNTDETEAAEDVMKTAIAAFRYKAIPEDVFQYLCDMNDVPFFDQNGEEFDADGFKKAFIYAMENGALDTITIQDAPIKEYFYQVAEKGIENSLNTQMVRAFRALLYYVTGHGFYNENGSESCKQIRDLLLFSDQSVNLESWNLRGADLPMADLHGANLQDVSLDAATLQRADLHGAKLQGAKLKMAVLHGANLKKANLKGANLQGADLEMVDLENANLEGANLQGAKLERAVLQEAEMRGADLQWAVLIAAVLKGVNLEFAQLEGAQLNGTNLEKAQLHEANLERANLQGANLQGANLQGAKLNRADFQGANLKRADLRGAKLGQICLVGARLEGTILRDVNLAFDVLERADLQGADLQGAGLQGADLQGADLRKANLRGANLEGANLQGAKLQEAHLERAYLQGANLQGAGLQEANLQDADMIGADMIGAHLYLAHLERANLEVAQLEGAVLEKSDIQEANLKRANLRGAKLQRAHLYGADLTRADLRGANLESADLRGANLGEANLIGAELKRAVYCAKPGAATVFPVGFNPKKHNMVKSNA